VKVVVCATPHAVNSIGGAIRFDFFVTIGDFFRPWAGDIAALLGARTW
jgi:hypothetical protein